MRTARDRTTI